MKKKPIVMISFVEGGENGGPFVSHKRIMESNLNLNYEFVPLILPKGHIGILNLKFLYKLIKEIKTVKPAILHIGGLQLTGFHFALASKLSGVKNIVLAVHGSSTEALKFSWFKKKILYFLELLTLKIVTGSYGVSQYVVEWDFVKQNSKKSFGCIYNLPPLNEEKLSVEIPLREELNIDNKDILIISTGRITQEKGYHILSDVIKKMGDKTNVKFVIAGEGDYLSQMREKLKNEIKNKKVFLLGYRPDINNILAAGDIFVICTLHETLCISLLEAANHKLALVATDVGGIPEIIKHNSNGFLTKKEDSTSVVIELNKLINDKVMRETFGLRSKERIEEKFSRELIIRKIDEMYRSLLNDT